MTGRLPINGAMATSFGAIAITVAVVLWQTPGVLSALAAPSAPADITPKGVDEHLTKHEAAAKRYADRFVGRSLFYMPTPPQPKPKPRPVEAGPVATAAPAPAPPPAEYSGPLTPKLIVGEVVWFSSSGAEKTVCLKVGEESNGVKLLSTAPPWSISVHWSGKDFDVRMFKAFPTPEKDPFATQTTHPAGAMPGLIEAPSQPAATTEPPPGEMSSAIPNR